MWIYPVACVLNTYVFCRTMFSIQRALHTFVTVVPRPRTIEKRDPTVATAAHQDFLQQFLHKDD